MKNLQVLLLVAFVLLVGTFASQASMNVNDIVDAAETVFASVAAVCVTIGVFMIGYRLARKIR